MIEISKTIDSLVRIVKMNRFTTATFGLVAASILVGQANCYFHKPSVIKAKPVVQSVGFLSKYSGFDFNHDGKIDCVVHYKMNNSFSGVETYLGETDNSFRTLQHKYSSAFLK